MGQRTQVQSFISKSTLTPVFWTSSNMFEPIFDRYLVDEKIAQAVVAPARDSLAIDRAYRGALASAMLEISE